jgi:hypothetical protein
MKLHQVGTANRKISKDGFAPAAPALARRVAQSFFEIDTIPSFDIRYFTPWRDSVFDIRFLRVSSFDQTGRFGGQRLG